MFKRVRAEGELMASDLRALKLAAEGLPASLIGHAMGTTEANVKRFLKRGRDDLKAHNTTHAVAIAIRRGLI